MSAFRVGCEGRGRGKPCEESLAAEASICVYLCPSVVKPECQRLEGRTRGESSFIHPCRKAYRTISVRLRRPSFSLMRTR
jgi:hypothetical protein